MTDVSEWWQCRTPTIWTLWQKAQVPSVRSDLLTWKRTKRSFAWEREPARKASSFSIWPAAGTARNLTRMGAELDATWLNDNQTWWKVALTLRHLDPQADKVKRVREQALSKFHHDHISWAPSLAALETPTALLGSWHFLAHVKQTKLVPGGVRGLLVEVHDQSAWDHNVPRVQGLRARRRHQSSKSRLGIRGLVVSGRVRSHTRQRRPPQWVKQTSVVRRSFQRTPQQSR